MNHYRDEWVANWCQENGWTELFLERKNSYWAFPPGAVMPEPIPTQTLRLIKQQNGFCVEEKAWLMAMGGISLLGTIFSVWFRCPIPIVFAFAFDAIAVARLEVDEV